MNKFVMCSVQCGVIIITVEFNDSYTQHICALWKYLEFIRSALYMKQEILKESITDCVLNSQIYNFDHNNLPGILENVLFVVKFQLKC